MTGVQTCALPISQEDLNDKAMQTGFGQDKKPLAALAQRKEMVENSATLSAFEKRAQTDAIDKQRMAIIRNRLRATEPLTQNASH